MAKFNDNISDKKAKKQIMKKKPGTKRRNRKIFQICKDPSKKNSKTRKNKRINTNYPVSSLNKKIEDKNLVSNKSENSQKKSDSKSISQTKEEKTSIANYFFDYILNFLSSNFENSVKSLFLDEIEQFRENSERYPGINYNRDDRIEAILFIRKELEKIIPVENIPKNFLFSVIALGDYYLAKTDEMKISGKKVKEIFITSAGLIGKDMHVYLFNSNKFLCKFINEDILIEREKEILITVEAVLYPIKAYDFFERYFVFFFKKTTTTESKECNDIMRAFWLEFYHEFHKFMFYFLLIKEELDEQTKPSSDFFSCFLLTYEKFRYFLSKQSFIGEKLKEFLYIMQKNLNYQIELVNTIKEKIEEIMPSNDYYII